MNAPAQHERFQLPPGKEKAVYTKDQKIPHAATIVIACEDHTAGNTLRCQLLRNPCVRFAGYRLPHPLKYELHVRVQTDGSITPAQAVDAALGELDAQLDKLETELQNAVAEHKKEERLRINF